MKKYISLLFCLCSISGYSQHTNRVKEASLLMKKQKFEQAAELWKSVISDGMGSANAYFKLGLCYYKSFDQQPLANECFRMAITDTRSGYSFNSSKITYAPVDAYFFLAESFMLNNQPDSALYYYSEYKKRCATATPYPVEKRITNCANAIRLQSEPLNIVAENLGNNINSKYAETHPVVALNNSVMFFASRRPKSNQLNNKLDNDDDIYMSIKLTKSVWGKAMALPFNTCANEHPVCITVDGKMLIFARQIKGQYDLFYSNYNSGNWSEPVSLGKSINSKADELEASITLDGKYLYFSSNRNNSDKTFDIFVSKRKPNGKWGNAEKLPIQINTLGNECFPYIHPEGHTLFFSTTGSNENIGNLDVFYSTKESNNKWSNPKILRYPINTTANDFGFSITSEGRRYATQLTSFNSFDIVEFTGNEKYLDDFGMSIDASRMVAELNVMEMFEVEKIIEKEVQTTDIVEVQTEIPNNPKIEEDSIKSYSIDNLDLEKIDSAKREMIFQKVKDYYTNLFKTDKRVLFKTLYFNFNSAELLLLSQNELRLLIEYMYEHKDVKVEVIGHTDILGNWDVNLNISRDRAQSVYQFLIKNKIAHNRIIYYGKGSAEPIASNDDENGRAKNRRVEIMLLK